jgi:hypothetical protein
MSVADFLPVGSKVRDPKLSKTSLDNEFLSVLASILVIFSIFSLFS